MSTIVQSAKREKKVQINKVETLVVEKKKKIVKHEEKENREREEEKKATSIDFQINGNDDQTSQQEECKYIDLGE